MTIAISSTLQKRITLIAAKIGKTPQSIVNEAIGDYIERNSWLNQAIKEGVQSAASESRVTHDAVWKNFEKRREQHLKKQRKAA